MGELVIELRDVRKEFFRKGRTQAGNFAAVAGASLAVGAGEMVACVGRSGSGKTTLLNMMAGLLAPTAGTVELCGQSLYALGDAELARLRNASIGVVPQGQSALHSLTVIQNVMLPSAMYGQHDDAAHARALALLEQLGIAALVDSYPRELSGGELRRMAIARALAGGPRLLLADEPTGDLDEATTADVLAVIAQAAEQGTAVFMVTHDTQASACAHRVLHMDAGSISSESQ